MNSFVIFVMSSFLWIAFFVSFTFLYQMLVINLQGMSNWKATYFCHVTFSVSQFNPWFYSFFFFSYSNSHCFIIYHLNSVFSFHNDILLRIQTKSNRIVFMYNFMENVIILFPIHVVTGVKNNPSLT